MITISKNENTKIKGNDRYILVELRGLSTDEKPTVYDEEIDSYIDNGSTFIEIDTGKIYFYDLENEQWNEA
jgi:CRISPR/Cas system CSM-associated protein Csm4 (group 5 of RAMP superfamily)